MQIKSNSRSKKFAKYHLLDIRNARHGYIGGYTDPVEMVLLANMAILVQFIKKEKPFEVVNWNSDPEHKNAASEMKAIYKWWIKDRKIAHDKWLKQSDKAYPDGWFNLEPLSDGTSRMVVPDRDKWEGKRKKVIETEMSLDAKDDEMLERLLKIRRFLWT
jgi:hypothetical protein